MSELLNQDIEQTRRKPSDIVSPSGFTETYAEALNRLFNNDPRTLDDSEIEFICQELRAQRANFALKEEQAAMQEKTPKGKRKLSREEAAQLSLEDLLA